eukprot:2677274-Rhodomonas_salina.1
MAAAAALLIGHGCLGCAPMVPGLRLPPFPRTSTTSSSLSPPRLDTWPRLSPSASARPLPQLPSPFSSLLEGCIGLDFDFSSLSKASAGSPGPVASAEPRQGLYTLLQWHSAPADLSAVRRD